MKISIKITACIILIFNSLNIYSQSENTITTRDRIFFGGSFGLMFGTYTQIELSPYIGWRFNPNLSAGVGFIYQYYGSSGYYGKYSTSIYGSNVFTKYTIIRDFPSKNVSVFTYAGYEALNLDKKYFGAYGETGRFIMHSILIGGGIRQYLGGRASMELLVLYNLNQRTYSPYNTPTLRVALNF